MAKIKETAKPSTKSRKTVAPKPESAPNKRTVKNKAKIQKKHDEPPPQLFYCSFCRKPSNQARRLIAGPNNFFICDECIDICNSILLEVDIEDKQDFWRQCMLDRLNKTIKKTVKKKSRKEI